MKAFFASMLAVIFVLAGVPSVVSAADFTIFGATNIAPVGSTPLSQIARGGKYLIVATGLPGNGKFGNSQSGVPTVYINGVAQSSWWYAETNMAGFLVTISGVSAPNEIVSGYIKTSTNLMSNSLGFLTQESDPALYGCNSSDPYVSTTDTLELVGRCPAGGISIALGSYPLLVYANAMKPGSSKNDVTEVKIGGLTSGTGVAKSLVLNSDHEWEIEIYVPNLLTAGAKILSMKINGKSFSWILDFRDPNPPPKKRGGQITSQ